MAQLDPLLTALIDLNAQELVMSEGRPAAVRLDGRLRPVSQKKLDRAQIGRLLNELSDRIDETTVLADPVSFHYELQPGQSFECEVREQQGQVVARLSPAPEAPVPQAPAPQAPAPQAPAPQASAPQASAPQASAPQAPAPQASAPQAPAPQAPAPQAPAPQAPVPQAIAPEGPAPIPIAETVPIPLPVQEAVAETYDMAPPEPAAPAPPARFEIAPEEDFDTGPSEPLPLQAQPVVASAPAPTQFEVDTDHGTKTPPAEVRPPAAAKASNLPIDRLLRHMVTEGASDLHLSSCETPMLRLHGDMCRIEGASPVSAEAMVELLDPIMPERNRVEFADCNDTDFAHEIPGIARFRANIFADRKGRGAVFRMIPSEILTAKQLALPEAVLGLCELSKGLVLVTGPTGSGKSTTLAAMIDHINRSRTDHIITIEDPVEFVHPNHKCLVNQREVITHTQGFKRALRAALREDPDIVLVGEMRDLETIAIAIETAETGHLVFGTLHTTTAISTVDRIIDQFPADRQAQIRTMLSESLRGVVAQTLLKKAGGGRVAALEVLIVTPAISNLIREGKTFQIPSMMQTGRKQGMRLLNDALIELVKNKTVEPDEAYRKAIDKSGLAAAIKTAGFKLSDRDDT